MAFGLSDDPLRKTSPALAQNQRLVLASRASLRGGRAEGFAAPDPREKTFNNPSRNRSASRCRLCRVLDEAMMRLGSSSRLQAFETNAPSLGLQSQGDAARRSRRLKPAFNNAALKRSF
ncbi:MAG: hypothetical protein PHS57_03740 [Alphaproteobacteria bacterium]|nr:hypothetical protein [Alphaproteobacteria bacterium]